VTIYSTLFHYVMMWEGRNYSWMTGLYWTLTVMSTLGFGDITFQTDAGRAFSMVVLVSGLLFVLVLFPVTFIRLFYEPWIQAREAQRAPRQLPAETRGHVILTHYDEVSTALIRRLDQFSHDYVLLVPDVAEALRLHDSGVQVAVGELDDPDTYRRLRVDQAALVVATGGDTINTAVAFTVRGVCERVPIVASASEAASVDVLELAGSTHVLRLEEMLGRSFSRRTMGADAVAHPMGRFDELLIAEATTKRTPLAGKTVRESGLRENIGVTVLGVWKQGEFETAQSDTLIQDNTVLVLAGSKASFDYYNEIYLIYNVSIDPVLIIGGGRVGQATARALADRGMDYMIVEKGGEGVPDSKEYVAGDAAELEVLKRAGIEKTPTVIITTHDDDVNIYLTIYCRRLRPDVQIISRAKYERNVRTLHRAGADIVMSYASMGANAILNVLERGRTLMLAEGLDVFRVAIPSKLRGKTLAESQIREETGCVAIAIRTDAGMEVTPDPYERLPEVGELLLIGASDAEERFLDLYGGTIEHEGPEFEEIATAEDEASSQSLLG